MGKITSSGRSTIKIPSKVSITSTADIANTNGAYAIECDGCGLNIHGGTVMTRYDGVGPAAPITDFKAIYYAAGNGFLTVAFGPTILGSIYIASGYLYIPATFAPGNKTYSVTLAEPVNGQMVVSGSAGIEHKDAFTLTNQGWNLAVSDTNLVANYPSGIIKTASTSSARGIGIVVRGNSFQVVGAPQAVPVRIYNLRGGVLLNRVAAPKESVSFAHLPRGMYMLKAGGQTFRLKR